MADWRFSDGRHQGNDQQSKSTVCVALVTRFFHRTIHMIRSHALKKHSIHVIILASTTRTIMWRHIVLLHQLFSNFFIGVNRWIIKTCILVNNLLRRFTNHQTFLIFLIHISISCLVILVPSSQDEREGQYSVFTACDVCRQATFFALFGYSNLVRS